ncbi:MAG TPA: serine/threonine-protein kinase [Planctomycetota bacterium]|nr:serine/threonine-protein kinase [Planctomycetota bacterium]
MNARWRRIEDIFQQALLYAPERRGSFLDEACAGDLELRGEVESLLASDAAGASVVGGIVRESAQEILRGVEAGAGQRIGPYRILDELGHGGMGSVYLAERADLEFEQRVAIKLMRAGLGEPELRQRFLAERQILARLTHPHIARLLDGGTTRDGVPYLVMEHIEGEPIDVYCARRGLPLQDRIELFRRVCAAVHFAHQNLVVHRDLKPSNILVDATGAPKLLDFGIAKLLDSTALLHTVALTRTAQPMTPLYASPEQVRGEPITTATDVYALGALLYELLTGVPAHRFLSSTAAEIERVVCHELPERPSAAVPRGVLAADLDRIVLQALRKEPERRYASVADLADDLRLFLEGRPVRAQDDTWRYRASKFVKRHTIAVTAAAAVFLVVAGLAVVLAFLSVDLARERDRARGAEAQAKSEAATAQQVSAFLIELFRVSDPGERLGRTVTAREILDRGAERLREELADQPVVRSRLLATVGTVYAGLGLFDESTALLEEALELQREHLGADPETARTLRALGAARIGAGEFGAAEEGLREALAMRRALAPADGVEEAGIVNDLARSLYEGGRYDEAEPLLRESLELHRATLGPDHPEVASGLTGLAGLLRARGDHAGAVPLLEQARDIRLAAHGPIHPAVAASYSNLAGALFRSGDLDRAEELYLAALDLDRRLYDGAHPDTAEHLNNLGLLADAQGDLAAAQRYLEQSAAMHRELDPEGHPALAYPLNNLGLVLNRRGDVAGAEKVLREVLELRRRLLSDDHPHIAFSLEHLGIQLYPLGRIEEAETVFAESLSRRRRQLGEGHADVGLTLHSLGRCRLDAGDVEGALTVLEEAVDILRRTLGADDPRLATALTGLGAARVARGEAALGEPLHREALAILTRALPAGNFRIAGAQCELAVCLLALGREEEARSLAREGLPRLESVLGDGHARVTRLRLQLGAAAGPAKRAGSSPALHRDR